MKFTYHKTDMPLTTSRTVTAYQNTKKLRMLMFINKTNKLTQLSCKQLVEFSKTGLGDQQHIWKSYDTPVIPLT